MVSTCMVTLFMYVETKTHTIDSSNQKSTHGQGLWAQVVCQNITTGYWFRKLSGSVLNYQCKSMVTLCLLLSTGMGVRKHPQIMKLGIGINDASFCFRRNYGFSGNTRIMGDNSYSSATAFVANLCFRQVKLESFIHGMVIMAFY